MPDIQLRFIIGAGILPTGIASYAIVGEKIEKSLEPLLATPASDGDVLMGKSLAALIPAISTTFIAAVDMCSAT